MRKESRGGTVFEPSLSIIVTAKDKSDPKLADFLESVDAQTYPRHLIEKLVITEGNSESAKAIGIRRAKGHVVGIFASDNYLDDPNFIKKMMYPFKHMPCVVASTPARYSYMEKDDILNRYFALTGVNDPIPWYLDKHDKIGYGIDNEVTRDNCIAVEDIEKVRTYGDNGFFVKKECIMQADLDHYFHIDVCQDMFDKGLKKYALVNTSLWHRTGGNIFKFFIKRFRYANQYSKNRRWHMITKKDIPNLLFFIFTTVTLVYPLALSLGGYLKVRDKAWFMHLPVCLFTIITYCLLTLKHVINNITSTRDA